MVYDSKVLKIVTDIHEPVNKYVIWMRPIISDSTFEFLVYWNGRWEPIIRGRLKDSIKQIFFRGEPLEIKNGNVHIPDLQGYVYKTIKEEFLDKSSFGEDDTNCTLGDGEPGSYLIDTTLYPNQQEAVRSFIRSQYPVGGQLMSFHNGKSHLQIYVDGSNDLGLSYRKGYKLDDNNWGSWRSILDSDNVESYAYGINTPRDPYTILAAPASGGNASFIRITSDYIADIGDFVKTADLNRALSNISLSNYYTKSESDNRYILKANKSEFATAQQAADHVAAITALMNRVSILEAGASSGGGSVTITGLTEDSMWLALATSSIHKIDKSHLPYISNDMLESNSITIDGVTIPLGGSGSLAGIFAQNTNAGSADKLTTSRKIWGQSFNGTADVSGALSNATTGSFSDDVDVRRLFIKGSYGKHSYLTQNSDYDLVYNDGSKNILIVSGSSNSLLSGNADASIGTKANPWKYAYAEYAHIGSASANSWVLSTNDTLGMYISNGTNTYMVFDPETTSVRRGSSSNNANVALGTSAIRWSGLFSTSATLSSYLMLDGTSAESQRIYFGSKDAYLEYKDNKFHFSKGVFSDSFVAGKGVGSGSGSAGTGMDLERMWIELAHNGSEQINKSHLSTALADYALKTSIPTKLSSLVDDLGEDVTQHQHRFIRTSGTIPEDYLPYDAPTGLRLYYSSSSPVDSIPANTSILSARAGNNGRVLQLAFGVGKALSYRVCSSAGNKWLDWRTVLTNYNYSSYIGEFYLKTEGGTMNGDLTIAAGSKLRVGNGFMTASDSDDLYLSDGLRASLVLDKDANAVRRGKTASATTLGTAEYPWVKIYGKTTDADHADKASDSDKLGGYSVEQITADSVRIFTPASRGWYNLATLPADSSDARCRYVFSLDCTELTNTSQARYFACDITLYEDDGSKIIKLEGSNGNGFASSFRYIKSTRQLQVYLNYNTTLGAFMLQAHNTLSGIGVRKKPSLERSSTAGSRLQADRASYAASDIVSLTWSGGYAISKHIVALGNVTGKEASV